MSIQASGAYRDVQRTLREQRTVVLDGGMATELPHRHGQDEERLWGIEALVSSPDAVAEVHRRYLAAGVDVLTTNTWGLPTAMGAAEPLFDASRQPVHWMEVARRGVALARAATEQAGRGEECAVGFSINGNLDDRDGPETVSLLARALGDDPPDLFVLETLSVIRPSLWSVIEALVATEIPVWLSFRRCRHGLCGVYGQHWGGPEGDAFGRAARRFAESGVEALLVNCIPPDHVDGMVSYLRDFTDLPLGVYPNLGYHTTAGWRSETEIDGAQYAELALRWRAEGAQIIGGCCGTRPEHIAAAHDALEGVALGHERRPPTIRGRAPRPDAERASPWADARGRGLSPLPFPRISCPPGVTPSIPGSALMWRVLFDEGIGAHQRCLDIGCGVGLHTVQLALNGAEHVHAIDVSERAVATTLGNAFRNEVAEQVSGESADLFPWIPSERYEVIVANLPQTPIDPAAGLLSHRPVDYWGRGLVDQVLSKLPRALAPEGLALVTVTSILSARDTAELIDRGALAAEVVAWELVGAPAGEQWDEAHLSEIEQRSDAFRVQLGDEPLLVAYVLAIRHASATRRDAPEPG